MNNNRWTSNNISDQSGRVVIVTGGNSGIGYETSKALAEKGAHVVVASRSEARGAKAVEQIARDVRDAKVDLLLLDLADLGSAGRFVEGLQVTIRPAGPTHKQRRRYEPANKAGDRRWL